ncbi:MAG TPA: winged helix-turn-helix domain-containing protein [Anaerolineae bacterium]|nr:winged helix-turn-helix domain-containing protein [Anaerolineae bacterium]
MSQMTPDAPLYQQLYAHLRAEIESGEFGPGDVLPSERTLAAEYGINRETVRKAIQLLVTEGMVRSYQGSGTLVFPHWRPWED